MCIYIYKYISAKEALKGDHAGLAFGQDAFLHSCYLAMRSQVLKSCFLLEVLAGLVSTFTLILFLSPLKGCSHVDEWCSVNIWGLRQSRCYMGRVRESSPPGLGHYGEMWNIEDKRSSLYYNIFLKRLSLFFTHTDPVQAVMLLLLNSRKKFLALGFQLLCFLGFLEPFFVWVFFWVGRRKWN